MQFKSQEFAQSLINQVKTLEDLKSIRDVANKHDAPIWFFNMIVARAEQIMLVTA